MEAAKEKNTNSNNKLTHDVSSHVKIPFLCLEGACCIEPCSHNGHVCRNNVDSGYPRPYQRL